MILLIHVGSYEYKINIDSKHLFACMVLIAGFLSSGCVFLMISFLELEPAYLCSAKKDFSIEFPCVPRTKVDNLAPAFCGTNLNYRVNYTVESSLNNWFV